MKILLTTGTVPVPELYGIHAFSMHVPVLSRVQRSETSCLPHISMFLTEYFKLAKKNNVHVIISGNFVITDGSL
jgi:hypothetical protein